MLLARFTSWKGSVPRPFSPSSPSPGLLATTARYPRLFLQALGRPIERAEEPLVIGRRAAARSILVAEVVLHAVAMADAVGLRAEAEALERVVQFALSLVVAGHRGVLVHLLPAIDELA